jgi:3-oxoacyl-[acyl-carrier-protein] synthase II
MQKRRRVAITGIGAVTPIGITVKGMWDGLRSERSAIRTITRFDASAFRSHNAAEVRAFDPGDFLDRKRAKRLDRFGHFSVACARLAIEDAGLDLEHENRERIGATMGSALGGIGFAEEQFGIFLKDGIAHVEPQLALNVFVGASSCNVAIEFGLMGPNSTNGMSCASGTIGVGDAFRLIRDDYADAMLCGGAEAPLMPLCFAAFTIIRAMSTRNDDPEHASRPSALRQGA